MVKICRTLGFWCSRSKMLQFLCIKIDKILVIKVKICPNLGFFKSKFDQILVFGVLDRNCNVFSVNNCRIGQNLGFNGQNLLKFGFLVF